MAALYIVPALTVSLWGTQGRQFSVADDIRSTSIAVITFSPDYRYFAVLSERGRLDIDRPESCLRIYTSGTIRRMLSSNQPKAPLPFWNFCRAMYPEGPNIQDVRWLRDSSSLSFLGKTASGNLQLFLAKIAVRKLETLTPESQDVTGFDVHNRDRFVYTALSPAIRLYLDKDRRSPAVLGTGRALRTLLPTDKNAPPDIWDNDLSELWAVRDGKRTRIVDAATKHAVPVHLEGERALALSPDGRRVVTALTVKLIPKQWESLYPPALPSSPYQIRAREQDSSALAGQRDVSQYILIDLTSGRIEPLVHAPIGTAAGWWGMSRANWSADGRFVVLSNTFVVPSTPQSVVKHEPCVAVLDLRTRQISCVAYRADLQNGHDATPLLSNASFSPSDDKIVSVAYDMIGGHADTATFARNADGLWAKIPRLKLLETETYSVSIEQTLNRPPFLLATDLETHRSRALWEPNQWMSNLEMGKVSVYKWRDRTGREWIGGLYLPPEYIPGRRYPLVIQTHGFDEQKFAPSGPFTTAFAAQELASAGIIVLQVRDCAIRGTPEEGPCQLAGYKAAVEKLSGDGLVDATKVGIIGFSRTCYYVLAALTEGSLQFKAASITDGVDEGYLQYMLDIDETSDNSIAHEADAIIGTAPFGLGLVKWLERSPAFNMHRVHAPLQVVATAGGLLQMWEPYAALRYLRKPVDLLILNSNEHVLSRPSERLISQGSTVDWFRFWLQDYRDLDPAKDSQYERWDAMRKAADAP